MTDPLDALQAADEARTPGRLPPNPARDALASIFEHGFEHAEEGRPYDYADELMRRMAVAGWEFVPSDDWGEIPTDELLARLRAAEAAAAAPYPDCHCGAPGDGTVTCPMEIACRDRAAALAKYREVAG